MGDTDVNGLWADEVDPGERTGPDFESRKSSISIYDTANQYRRLSTALGNAWGMERNAATDRALRIYIAYIIDTHDLPELRDAMNQTVLIPPAGWLEENQSQWDIPLYIPEPDPVPEPREAQYVPSTTNTVKEMATVLVDEFDAADTLSNFAKDALKFIADVDQLEGDLVEIHREEKGETDSDEIDDAIQRDFLINDLFGSEARRDLVMYFMSELPDPDGENKSRIAEKSDTSRNSVGRHLDSLLEFGIVEEKGDGSIRKYAPNRDSEVVERIVALNDVLHTEFPE